MKRKYTDTFRVDNMNVDEVIHRIKTNEKIEAVYFSATTTMKDQQAALLADALKQNTHLKSLNASSVDLGPLEADFILDALIASNTIEEAILIQNPFNFKDIEEKFKTLMQQTKNIRNIEINLPKKDRHIQSFFDAIMENDSLDTYQ